MKKVENKVKVVKEYYYEAEDGRCFYKKKDCEIYEKYYKIPLKELLSPYIWLDNWEGISPFRSATQCFVFKRLPEEIVNFLNISDKDRIHLDFYATYYLGNRRFRNENDIIYLKRYGSEWTCIGTKYQLQEEITYHNQAIADIERFEKKQLIKI